MSDIGLYSDPRIYDILHTPGTAGEVDGLIRIEAVYSRPRAGERRWLEPACGSGRYLRAARARGIPCVGFDLSAGMVAYAQARAARASSNATERYLVASMTDFAGSMERPFSFAFNPINTIRHLGSDDEMLAHFEQIARVLRPGAAYAVGMSLSLYGGEQPSEDVWEGSRGGCRVRQAVQFIPPERGRVERVVSHLCVTTPAGERHSTSSYHLRTYSRAEFAALVARSPLVLVAATDDDGNAIDIPELGYAMLILARTDR